MKSFVVAAGALLLASASPVHAQYAMELGGPFIATAIGAPLHVTLVSGPPYVARPVEPVEVWVWTFYDSPQGFCGQRCDVDATLTTLDCDTREVFYGPREYYLGAQFVEAKEGTGRSEIAGGIMGFTIDAVCDPDYFTDYAFPDFASAYEGVKVFFEE